MRPLRFVNPAHNLPHPLQEGEEEQVARRDGGGGGGRRGLWWMIGMEGLLQQEKEDILLIE